MGKQEETLRKKSSMQGEERMTDKGGKEMGRRKFRDQGMIVQTFRPALSSRKFTHRQAGERIETCEGCVEFDAGLREMLPVCCTLSPPPPGLQYTVTAKETRNMASLC